MAADFFTVDTVFLQRPYVLFFIHLASRRILRAACTKHPSGDWVAQQVPDYLVSATLGLLRPSSVKPPSVGVPCHGSTPPIDTAAYGAGSTIAHINSSKSQLTSLDSPDEKLSR